MHFFLPTVLLAIVTSHSLVADSISNVEFTVPAPIGASKWKVTQRQNINEGGIQAQTFLYVPDSEAASAPSDQPPEESFVASANNLPNSGPTKESLTTLLQNQAPEGQTVELKPIQQTTASALYEWSAKDSSKETAHGFIRIFSNPKGSVMLGYMNLNPTSDSFKKGADAWRKALTDAKEVQ